MSIPQRLRNDPAQYDDLVDQWWARRGPFAPLHWLAAARSTLIPPAERTSAVLVDLACGGGLLAPHVVGKGYRHVGVDIGTGAVRVAREQGMEALQGDVRRLPIRGQSADVVVAGEIFEHVRELDEMVDEIARVLRPGGILVCDTLADTRRCTFLLVTVGERLRIAPRGIHDPDLFVAPERLRKLCSTAGIDLQVHGLRPSLPDLVAWLAGWRDEVQMRDMRSTACLYQGTGRKVGPYHPGPQPGQGGGR